MQVSPGPTTRSGSLHVACIQRYPAPPLAALRAPPTFPGGARIRGRRGSRMKKLTASIALVDSVLLAGAWIPVLAAGGVRSETIQPAEIVPATDAAVAEAQATNGTGANSRPDNAQDAAKPAPA